MDTSCPGQGTSHAHHLPLDQGLTWHPKHDTDGLGISDIPPTPAAMSDIGHKNFTSTSIYTPSVSKVTGASNAIPAPNKSCLKDSYSCANNSRAIGRTVSTQTSEPSSNAVSISAPVCKQGARYPPTFSSGFKALAASVLNRSESSAQLPLIKGSSTSALWPQSRSLCHWDIQCGVLLPPSAYDSRGDLISRAFIFMSRILLPTLICC